VRELKPIPDVNLVRAGEQVLVPDGYWAAIANTTGVTIDDKYGGFSLPNAWMKTAGEETGLPRVWGGVVLKGADGKSAQVMLHPLPTNGYDNPCLTVAKKACGCASE